MNDKTEQLISNLADDLKAMSLRDDKSLILDRTRANDLRIAAFMLLEQSKVVTIKAGMKTVIITLEL